MKKLLTVSLVAVMAVSAAHAKIASTDYVDGEMNTKVGTVQFEKGVAVGKTNVTAAIDAVADVVAGLSGNGDGSVASQIAAAEKKASDDLVAHAKTASETYETKTDAGNKLTEAKGYTDAAAKADAEGKLASGFVKSYVDTSVATIQGNLGDHSTVISKIATFDGDGNLNGGALGAVATSLDSVAETLEKAAEMDENGILTGGATKAYTDAAIQDLDVEKVTAGDGKYFNTYVEADGKIAMEQKEFETTIAAGVNNAPTTGAVYSAIEAAKGAAKSDLENVDSTHAAETNKFVTGMTQVDGKITEVTKSSIDAAVIALGQVPTECGANGTNKCALSVSKGTFTWEIIEE